MKRTPFDPFAIAGFGDNDGELLDSLRGIPAESPQAFLRNSTVAVIYWAEHGGPIRTIIDGRKTRPTGFFPSIKGGFRSMPWDSFLEEGTMQLADLSSRVSYLLAQPHRVEVTVKGNRGKPLIYFPDLLLRTDLSFVRDLQRGMPFIDAAAVPRTARVSDDLLETVIIEVKADKDSRDDDERYQIKLEFVEEIYRRRGFHYFQIRASPDLSSSFVRTARLMDWRKAIVIDIHDVRKCLDVFGRCHVVPYGRLAEALGGGNFGRAKVNGLHYRGLISIDLRKGLSDEAAVYLLTEEGDR